MSDSLGFLITDVARLLRRDFDARAHDIGVTRPQWRVLVMLNHGEGINQGCLAERLEVEPITASRMVDRLQEADLVERRPDPDDRRAWLLFMTDKSRRLLADLVPVGQAVLDDMLNGFSPQERDELGGYLKRMHTNMSRQQVTRQPDWALLNE